jgi:glycosyltransferase involved in cell wall biosynthesis
MFGSLHPIWPAEPLFSYLREAGALNNRKIEIISIGKLGPGEQLWKQLQSQNSGAIQFLKLGQRSTNDVSAVMQASDFGLATSPWELIGKSSSVAAMLQHGLPVIVNRDDVHFRRTTDSDLFDPLLIKMDSQLPTRIAGLSKRPAQARLPVVARDFLRLVRRPSNSSE